MSDTFPDPALPETSLDKLLAALGLGEEPYGLFYTDVPPTNGFAPDAGPPLSLDREARGEVDWGAVWGHFSCVMGKLWLARKKRAAAWFDAEHYGCPGGSFYLGFHAPQLEFITCYVSTGIPGSPVTGERYLPSPASARRFFTELAPRPAPARYCVLKPVTHFTETETPETVIFFGRGEVLTGLSTLAAFVTDDFEIVAAPFGAGCSFIATWLFHYQAAGHPRAVLGCGDPSARKFMKPDEMTFTVPYSLYQQFLARWPDSFLPTKTWAMVQKKIARSQEAWGE
ncbi:hypothetical protein DVDV_4237 [Desulfovibrio sp. DV]|uniref:DUF169 domain-containing protein n=1 Tax=Desulfovibrio sp. DV TaxID=1844708 RepID=UPI00094B95EC|nr:DUF169 domain-containing protein [Desulfovibrio sp. DV]OLN24434.1 hypothetical protein DVDV_4237 [Desulfovibrio sp. DV]